MIVEQLQTFTCDAGWRNYDYVKITTSDGIVGWSEYGEGFGSPGVTQAVRSLTPLVVGQPLVPAAR